MAGESCNLNKDEAEIFKPASSSSSSSSSSSPPSHSASPPPPPPSSSTQPTAPATSLFLQPPLQQFPPSDRLESPIPPPAVGSAAISSPPETEERTQPSPSPSPNRCSSCHKRVRLTGFRCRCGELFCGSHRYSDTHECSFDYKAAGREQIAKDNPLIRAAKIIKI